MSSLNGEVHTEDTCSAEQTAENPEAENLSSKCPNAEDKNESRNVKKTWSSDSRLLLLSLLLTVVVILVSALAVTRVSCQAHKEKAIRCADLSADLYSRVDTEQLLLATEQSFSTEMDLVIDALLEAQFETLSEEDLQNFTGGYVTLQKPETMAYYVVDAEGRVLLSSEKTLWGKLLSEAGILTETQVDTLKREADQGAQGLVYDSTSSSTFCSEKIKREEKDTGYYLIFRKTAAKLQEKQSTASKEEDAISYYIDDGTDTVSLWVADLSTGIVTGVSEGSQRTLEELGLSRELLESSDGLWVTSETTGKEIYVRCPEGGRKEVAFLAVMESSVGNNVPKLTLIILAAGWIFLLFCVGLLLYRLYMTRNIKDPKELTSHLFVIIPVMAVLYMLLSVSIFGLLYLRWIIQSAEQCEVIMEEKLDDLEERADSLKESCQISELETGTVLAGTLSATGLPSDEQTSLHYYYGMDAETGTYHTLEDSFGNAICCMEASGQLTQKAELMGIQDLWILNEQGYAIASASSDWNVDLSTMTEFYGLEDAAESLRKVLYRQNYSLYSYAKDENGNITGTIIALPMDLYAAGTGEGDTSYVSVRTCDELLKGGQEASVQQQRGLLVYILPGQPKADKTLDELKNRWLSGFAATTGCSYVTLREGISEFGEKIYVIINKAVGSDPDIDLSAVTVPDTMTGDEMNFFRTYGEEKCLVHMKYKRDTQVYSAILMGEDQISGEKLSLMLFSLILSFLGLSVLGLAILKSWNEVRQKMEKAGASDSGREEALQIVYEAIDDRDRLLRILLVLVAVPALLLLTGFSTILRDKLSSGVFIDVFGGTWERSFNYVNLFIGLMFIFMSQVIAQLLKMLCNRLCKPLGSSAESIIMLVFSTMQYVILFASILYALYLLGVDLKSIGTLATVAAGAVAFSSQQILNDINSGFLLFFEGKVELGRHIQCDGFNGVITEIGMRSCTLEGDNGTTRTVNYSRMNSMTVYPEDKPKLRTKEDVDAFVKQKEEEQAQQAALEAEEAQAVMEPLNHT